MYKGQPLTLTQILPASISPDMFYVLAASLPAFLVMIVIGSSMIPRNSMSARVKALNERHMELRGELLATRRRRRRKPVANVNRMRQIVNKFNLLKNHQITQAQGLLIEAGWRSKDAVVIFAFFTLVMPIIMGIVGLVLMQMEAFGEGEDLYNMAAPIAGIYFGLKLPVFIVRRKRKKRYRAIQRALSDTLDLMTICAEAGLSLSAALNRVSGELGLAYPEMGEELALTSMEMGFLPDRNKALINLTERVKLDEIRGIIGVLVQTEKYGTPIAQAMRVLAAEFREQRMLRAENKAARLPAIMTVPMILFILPTLFIMIISPAMIRAQDAF